MMLFIFYHMGVHKSIRIAILFSSIVDLMSLVVCGIYPSLSSAYRAKALELNVSPTEVYDKLKGIELDVSAALLGETAASMTNMMQFLGDSPPRLLASHQVRIMEGNCLAATEHHLAAWKPYAAKALPGKYAGGTRPRLADGD
jgi:hypothetical protein